MHSEELDFTNIEMLRKKAEELLETKQHKSTFAEEEADLKKLVHELQVHQIELEMQNDELRQAYNTAEEALKKYTLLFDLSPMGYLTLNSDGAICELNFTAAEMLGDKRFSLIDSNFKLFISEESRPVFNNFFKRIYTSNAKESCKIRLGYNSKPLASVYLEGVVTGDNERCLLSVVDISKFNLQKNS
ncbi:MAG: PAS domain-containing protein [Bacteroidales bacterium]|nr:PAS domain-containing protein [Bacteroidales bacterium]MDD4673490.1 PAS domain-containing protein [Bacteroidales bacterium]